MGTEPTREWPGQVDWRMVHELLQAGQYLRVAELLHQARLASEHAGDTVRAPILAAARRICLACDQCRAEVESHRRAYGEAHERERQLSQQLRSILELINGHRATESEQNRAAPPALPKPAAEQPEFATLPSGERHSLWQRVQNMLVRGLVRLSSERGTLVVRAEAPTPSAAGDAEGPAAFPVVMAEGWRLPSLVVYCLGAFCVYQNDQLITAWDGLKGQAILKYLLAHHRRPIAKDILMDVFWRDADPEAARRNLHQAVYCLRQTLRRGQPDFQYVQFENDCYLLNPAVDVWMDFDEFEKHVQAGQRLEVAGRLPEAMAEYGVAEGLYQGDFLEEDLYEDWPSVQREQLRNTCLEVFDRLTEYYMQQGEYSAAIMLCQKVLAKDNCREGAHRRLMQCYVAQGQRHLAVRQYQTCVEALETELDLAPSEETVALYRRITATA